MWLLGVASLRYITVGGAASPVGCGYGIAEKEGATRWRNKMSTSRKGYSLLVTAHRCDVLVCWCFASLHWTFKAHASRSSWLIRHCTRRIMLLSPQQLFHLSTRTLQYFQILFRFCMLPLSLFNARIENARDEGWMEKRLCTDFYRDSLVQWNPNSQANHPDGL